MLGFILARESVRFLGEYQQLAPCFWLNDAAPSPPNTNIKTAPKTRLDPVGMATRSYCPDRPKPVARRRRKYPSAASQRPFLGAIAAIQSSRHRHVYFVDTVHFHQSPSRSTHHYSSNSTFCYHSLNRPPRRLPVHHARSRSFTCCAIANVFLVGTSIPSTLIGSRHHSQYSPSIIVSIGHQDG